MRLVIATGNAGKLKELRELLPPPAFEVLPQSQFTSDSVAETGLTFVENAILKARHASQAAGLPAIADDSGLEVDALDGAPGIYSARYAGEGASDEDNLLKLLAALKSKSRAERTARYQCALVFMRSPRDPSPLICQASWEGWITDQRRGTGGFGYDPIFELTDRAMTVAELPAAEKNLLSHRGKALRGLVAQLREIHRVGS
ncbi:MAG TPA: RdgB/HAM1 family non-canonical purine NTP pyrophosphatase [Steroidobacter sp.]|uniref:RdgB/HAM1 family non-canonical purine NTP pyrophosphatase n=1 Tax=Steroidobacter sp. TaxID=1978227 RepID=UPI002EDB45BE